jgi:hypothetical protein
MKPNLGLVEFNGSKANNIVGLGLGSTGTPGGSYIEPGTVFLDSNPNCKPDEK